MADDQIFEQLDKEKLKAELAPELLEQAKQSLIDTIQGGKKARYSWEQKGKQAPSDYDELFNESDSRYVKKEEVETYAESVVEKKLREKEEAEFKRQEEARAKQVEQIQNNNKTFDQEWYALQNEGKLPKVAPAIQEKINKGEKLTREEIQNDEGLQARVKLSEAVVATGKHPRLAFYEDYNKQPAGAAAPVLGGRPSAAQSQSDELDYSEVVKERKRIFGW